MTRRIRFYGLISLFLLTVPASLWADSGNSIEVQVLRQHVGFPFSIESPDDPFWGDPNFIVDCEKDIQEMKSSLAAISQTLGLSPGVLSVNETLKLGHTENNDDSGTWTCDTVVTSTDSKIAFKNWSIAREHFSKDVAGRQACDQFLKQTVKDTLPNVLSFEEYAWNTVFHGLHCEASGVQVIDLR
jgi:hypothetical protein